MPLQTLAFFLRLSMCVGDNVVGLSGMSRRMDGAGLCSLWPTWVAHLALGSNPRLEYGLAVLYLLNRSAESDSGDENCKCFLNASLWFDVKSYFTAL
jgi:hypothetical protein